MVKKSKKRLRSQRSAKWPISESQSDEQQTVTPKATSHEQAEEKTPDSGPERPKTNTKGMTDLLSYLLSKYFELSTEVKDKAPHEASLAVYAAKDHESFISMIEKYGINRQVMAGIEKQSEENFKRRQMEVGHLQRLEWLKHMAGEWMALLNVMLDSYSGENISELTIEEQQGRQLWSYGLLAADLEILAAVWRKKVAHDLGLESWSARNGQ